MSDALLGLEAEYCPPIDPALFSAIVSDYDLTNVASVQEARTTLDALKASAVEEEGSGFDPSGGGGYHFHDNTTETQSSISHTSKAQTQDTDETSLSAGLSNLGISKDQYPADTDDGTPDVNLDALENETKTLLLRDLFPDMNEFTINYTLRKCDYTWQRALDELLNQSFLQNQGGSDGEDKVLAKGIDAFYEENTAKRGRKGKRKGKNRASWEVDGRADSLPSLDTDISSSSNKWQGAQQDIDYISSTSGISGSLVRSVYYKNHTSIPETIAYFLRDTMKSTSKITSTDPTVQAHAIELGRDFPNIAPDYLTALIRLTHPSASSAHELAKALTTKRADSSINTPITPHYSALSLSDDDGDIASTQTRTSSAGSSRSIQRLDRERASALAASHSTAYRTASQQAQAAYRKSRSNHLMGGAAGYYAQVGREHAVASQQYNATAADALVDSQSSADHVDLHGVNVQDALRISKARVQSWWSDLGEQRVNGRAGASDRANGFSIITGVGRHSEGGKGKLGPAVSRMLTAEGWRVEGGSGVLVVKGKSRSR